MIESVTNPDAHINLRGLSVDAAEQKREPHFVPERDFTERDWERSLVQLEIYRLNSDWRSFASEAAALFILNPQRVRPLVTPDNWEGMEALLSRYRTRQEWTTFSYHARDLSVLDRNKTLSLITQSDWEAMLDSLKELDISNPSEFDNQVGSLAHLDFHKLVGVFSEKKLDEMVKRFQMETVGSVFIMRARNLLEVGQGRLSSIITDNDWKKMMGTYGMAKRHDETVLSYFASELTLLSRAVEAQQKNFQATPPPPLPEVRNF